MDTEQKVEIARIDEWIELLNLLSYMNDDNGLSDDQLDHLHDVLEFRPGWNLDHTRTMTIYAKQDPHELIVQVHAYGASSELVRFKPTLELIKKIRGEKPLVEREEMSLEGMRFVRCPLVGFGDFLVEMEDAYPKMHHWDVLLKDKDTGKYGFASNHNLRYAIRKLALGNAEKAFREKYPQPDLFVENVEAWLLIDQEDLGGPSMRLLGQWLNEAAQLSKVRGTASRVSKRDEQFRKEFIARFPKQVEYINSIVDPKFHIKV